MTALLNSIAGFVLLAVLSMQTAAGQTPQHLALVTEVQGNVYVSRGANGPEQQAPWGTQLFKGDRVRTAERASVSLLFSNSTLLTLGPNSSFVLSTGPAGGVATGTPKVVDQHLIAGVADLTIRREASGKTALLGGLRAGAAAQDLVLLTPRSTRIATQRPVFSWQAAQPFERYRVRLLHDGGVVWTGEVAGVTELAYPDDAPALQPGEAYFWQVEGETLLDGVKSPMTTFQVLSEDALQAVAATRERIADLFEGDPARNSYDYVLGAYYAKEGLLQDAISAFARIAARHPEAALPHEILGKLYTDVGLKDDAIGAYQQAILLGQND